MSAKTKTAPSRQSDSPLSNLVPAKFLADEYINRTIGGKRDVEILAQARSMKMNSLIFGPTGPGKTSCVLAYAAEYDIPFYSVSCNGAVDPRQLFGSWVPTEEAGIYVWQDGPVTMMVRNGGVLLLNEVNFMPPRIAASMYSLLDKRRTLSLIEHYNEVIVAHDNFQVIADYNPDYEGTRPLNEAFKNRFALKLFFDYEPSIEAELVSSDALLALATTLRDSHKTGEIETPISTNMLMEFEDIAYDIGFDFAIENFLNAFTSSERPAIREVVALHRYNLEQDFDDNNSDADNTDDGEYTLDELKLMSVNELKQVAAEIGLSSLSGLNKAQLFDVVARELSLI